jgi:excisionase family DNA binding protein
VSSRELTHIDAGEFLTVEEAASLLGLKEMSVRNYLSDGKLTTYKFKTLTLLKKEEVLRWRERQRGK